MERRARQVAQLGEEAAEGLGRRARFGGAAHHVVAARARDARARAPGLAALVHHEQAPVAARHELEHAPPEVGRAGPREGSALVREDARDVLHHARGLREDASVQALEDVLARAGRALELREQRVVDVTAAERARAQKAPGDVERLGDPALQRLLTGVDHSACSTLGREVA